MTPTAPPLPAAARTCQITCSGCTGTYTIDNSDGLPVELMDFSIEGDDTADVEDEEGDSPDQDGPD